MPNKDYFASIKLETIIYFQAPSLEKAEQKAEDIAGNLEVSVSTQAPKKYQSTEIDMDGYEIQEVELHD